MMALNLNQIRQDFPILHRRVHGKPLIYLDTAATAQKPQCVIDAITDFYRTQNSNIHRSVHTLADEATAAYEKARQTIADFIHAQSKDEIVFVRGATEGINLVANTFGRAFLNAGDEVIISEMEHHANIVPWQILRDEKGIVLKVIPLLDNGELDLSVYEKLFSSKTKLVAVTQASNALGTINPIKNMIKIAHQHNIPVLIDAAQSIVHGGVDVQDLDGDFLVFSGHKLYGPTGVGVLYAKQQWLEKLPPYHGGGEMIEHVTLEKTTYAKPPYKFEAGTPNIAGAIGLAKAIEYLQKLGIEQIQAYEQDLLAYATEQLTHIEGLRILGNAQNKVPVISFVMDNIHAFDLTTMLDLEGIAVRSGHHCAMPVMQRFGVGASVRVSFGLYSTREEIDRLIQALQKIQPLF